MIAGKWRLGLLMVSLTGTTAWAATTGATAKKIASPKPSLPVSEINMTVKPPASESGAGESGGERIEPMRVSMDFQDADVKDVLKVFSKQTGINVIAREDIGQRTITLYLEDVSVLDALDQILRAADLVSERQEGSDIYVVRPRPEKPTISTETRVYKLRYARVSTSRLARATEALGLLTSTEAQSLTAAIAAEVGTTSSAKPASGTPKEIGIDRVLREVLTEQGKLAVDERTNSLIVTDVTENFPRIEAVLNTLDVKTAQIMIESELLETSLRKVKDLGIEWGADSSGTLATLTPASRSTRAPFSTLFGEKSGVATQVSLGTINTSQFKAILQAIERDTDTKILARPKVLTLENEAAVVRLTSPQAVAIKSVTISQSGNVISTPERMTTGIIMSVTPQVNDNGYITMLVEPSVTRTVESQIDATIVDPKTRSARSLVRIRQGDTLVLGGLIDRSETDSMRKVPIASGIPFFGELFKDPAKDDNATELVVFVTPRIMPEATGAQVAWQSQSSVAVREQEHGASRQQMIEDTLSRLEHPRL